MKAQDLAQGAAAPPFKLFVGGISTHTTTEVLCQHFSKYGHLSDAVVMVKDGRPRGFGFVTFVSELAAAQALTEPQWIDGRFVDVKRAVPGERAQEKPSNKIFIGGLPQDVTTQKLRDYFSSYGVIADAVVMVDRQTSRSRGFGFVRFANGRQGAHAAQAVLRDFQDHWLEGKWVEVKQATPAATLEEMASRYMEDAQAMNQSKSGPSTWTSSHHLAGSAKRQARQARGSGSRHGTTAGKKEEPSGWQQMIQPPGHLLPASGSIDWHQLVVPPSLPTLLTGALGRGPSLSKDQPARGVKSYMSSPMKVTCSGFDSKDPGRASFPASWGGPTVLTLPRAPRWMWPSTIANA